MQHQPHHQHVPSEQMTSMQIENTEKAHIRDPALGYSAGLDHAVLANNNPNVHIFLTPIAAPSAFGFTAFFASTWMLNTWLADWYGSNLTGNFIWPFICIFGGVGQFLAGMFCFPARDNLASVFHCAWGAFYISWGIMMHIATTALVPVISKFEQMDELAMILVAMAFITGICWVAALGRDGTTAALTTMLFCGTVLQFAGYFIDDHSGDCIKAGAYFNIVASLIALYRAFAFLVEENFIGKFLPVFNTHSTNLKPLVRIPVGEPGVKKGQ